MHSSNYRRVLSYIKCILLRCVNFIKRIKTLVEIWKHYKHRLPSKMYEERMLQVADFLVEIEVTHTGEHLAKRHVTAQEG